MSILKPHAAMTAPAPSPLRDGAVLIWSALGALLPCLIPNTGSLVLALSIVAPLLLADRSQLKQRLMQFSPVIVVHAIIVLYLCLNALLAPVTDNAGGAIATIALAGLAFHICAAALPSLPERDLRLMAQGLFFGALLAAAFLAAEYLSRMSLLRMLQQAAEAAHVRAIRIEAGTWANPSYTYLSRNLVVLIMLAWAAAAFAVFALRASVRRIALPAFVISLFVAGALTASATARAGLAAGAAAWALARFAPRAAAPLVYGGWLIASLACIPFAQLIHRYRLYDVEWISSSFRHRMMIWSASSEWFWKNPFLGLGIGGARKINLNEGLGISASGIEGEPLNWHAHNSFVQAWFEAGAVGGLLLCLFGVLILRSMFRLPAPFLPYAVATFVSISVIGLAGFSLWAAWYLAGYGAAALCLLMAVFIKADEAPLRGPAGG